MTQFITGAPVWVWPLLAGLILIGLRARQERSVPAALVYALPLLGIMALRSVAGLPAGHWIWPVFVCAYGLGVWGGHRVQQPWILGREGAKVRLAGESLTLGLMMVVFWANFLGGVLQAVAPLLYQNPMFHLGFACILALSAGSFAGRALAVWRRI